MKKTKKQKNKKTNKQKKNKMNLNISKKFYNNVFITGFV